MKAFIKKRTGLAISYSHLFSPLLLACTKGNLGEQLYKSLTPSSATPTPSFHSVLDTPSPLKKRRRTRKVTACWKNSPNPSPFLRIQPFTLSFFRFNPPTPFTTQRRRLSQMGHGYS